MLLISRCSPLLADQALEQLKADPHCCVLLTILMQTLHKLVKDEQDLPLGSSALWNLMLSARPIGSTLDVKRSRHKKLGAFLKV